MAPPTKPSGSPPPARAEKASRRLSLMTMPVVPFGPQNAAPIASLTSSPAPGAGRLVDVRLVTHPVRHSVAKANAGRLAREAVGARDPRTPSRPHGIRENDCDIGQSGRAGDKHPTQPPLEDDGEDEARRPDRHRDEVTPHPHVAVIGKRHRRGGDRVHDRCRGFAASSLRWPPHAAHDTPVCRAPIQSPAWPTHR